MAVAEIIGAAIGILLLVIVAYLIVGGTLSVAETVAVAQKDLALQTESRMRTDLRMNTTETTIAGTALTFSLTNTGNEIIADYPHFDIYTDDNSGLPYTRYTYADAPGTAGTWAIIQRDNDRIHPNQFDPGEKIWITATFSGSDPVWLMVSTDNGVYAQMAAPELGWRT